MHKSYPPVCEINNECCCSATGLIDFRGRDRNDTCLDFHIRPIKCSGIIMEYTLALLENCRGLAPLDSTGSP